MENMYSLLSFARDSLLNFNWRVFYQAADSRTPFLERDSEFRTPHCKLH